MCSKYPHVSPHASLNRPGSPVYAVHMLLCKFPPCDWFSNFKRFLVGRGGTGPQHAGSNNRSRTVSVLFRLCGYCTQFSRLPYFTDEVWNIGTCACWSKPQQEKPVKTCDLVWWLVFKTTRRLRCGGIQPGLGIAKTVRANANQLCSVASTNRLMP